MRGSRDIEERDLVGTLLWGAAAEAVGHHVYEADLVGGVAPGLAQINPQLSALSIGNDQLEPEESDNVTFGVVYSPAWSEGQAWSDGITLSVDYYSVEIDSAVQGLSPGELIDACVETLDPAFCVNTPRTSSGQLDTVQNKLQNLGGIDASGYDIAFSYLSPETSFGTFTLDVDATHLAEYKEITNNPDGTQSVNDLTGQAPDETFFRAFPEWRAVTCPISCPITPASWASESAWAIRPRVM